MDPASLRRFALKWQLLTLKNAIELIENGGLLDRAQQQDIREAAECVATLAASESKVDNTTVSQVSIDNALFNDVSVNKPVISKALVDKASANKAPVKEATADALADRRKPPPELLAKAESTATKQPTVAKSSEKQRPSRDSAVAAGKKITSLINNPFPDFLNISGITDRNERISKINDIKAINTGVVDKTPVHPNSTSNPNATRKDKKNAKERERIANMTGVRKESEAARKRRNQKRYDDKVKAKRTPEEHDKHKEYRRGISRAYRARQKAEYDGEESYRPDTDASDDSGEYGDSDDGHDSHDEHIDMPNLVSGHEIFDISD